MPAVGGPTSVRGRAHRPRAEGPHRLDGFDGLVWGPSLIVLHRGPEPVLVEAKNIYLALFSGAVGHDGPAFVVHIEHQLLGLLLGVAEELLEDESDVVHGVDRIVPHQDHPWSVRRQGLVLSRFFELYGRGRAGHIYILSLLLPKH